MAMENNEDKSPKLEKASKAEQEQTNTHLYPDWAAIQAYYGPGIPLPPPGFNSIMASHVPHPCMWPPQPVILPLYGVPYGTIFSQSQAGVYTYPAVPDVSLPVSMEAPCNSSDNMDRVKVKKLKRLDEVSVPVSTCNGEGNTRDSFSEQPKSLQRGTERSKDASDGNIETTNSRCQSNLQLVAVIDNDNKDNKEGNSQPEGETNVISGGVSGDDVVPSNVGNVLANLNTEINAAFPLSICDTEPPVEVQNQNERQLKRERRKQANRESARRSRMRKQAEHKDLMRRYESLTAENLALKSELEELTKNSNILRLENAALEEKLKRKPSGQAGVKVLAETEGHLAPSKNLAKNLESFDSADLVTKMDRRERDAHGSSNPENKFHQLLEPSSRADAVAAR
ncbi:G-box binding protein, multifunctional mosaic region [Dillenia turbinata]|uniref:G-box binding protein, multifunctional mosaic region n=1 Tax=Dillenia turbinata TaxID=194707 RepID=A0AAN8ZIQ0_9MAGN